MVRFRQHKYLIRFTQQNYLRLEKHHGMGNNLSGKKPSTLTLKNNRAKLSLFVSCYSTHRLQHTCVCTCYSFKYFYCIYRRKAPKLHKALFTHHYIPEHCVVLYVILPGMSVVRVATVFPLTTLRLSIGPQASIDPPFPAVGPARRAIASTQIKHNKEFDLNIRAYAHSHRYSLQA